MTIFQNNCHPLGPDFIIDEYFITSRSHISLIRLSNTIFFNRDITTCLPSNVEVIHLIFFNANVLMVLHMLQDMDYVHKPLKQHPRPFEESQLQERLMECVNRGVMIMHC